MSDSSPYSRPMRLCDCGCNRRFVPPPSAPHKRFASEACRNSWHSARRTIAAQMLADAERSETDGQRRETDGVGK